MQVAKKVYFSKTFDQLNSYLNPRLQTEPLALGPPQHVLKTGPELLHDYVGDAALRFPVAKYFGEAFDLSQFQHNVNFLLDVLIHLYNKLYRFQIVRLDVLARKDCAEASHVDIFPKDVTIFNYVRNAKGSVFELKRDCFLRSLCR
jgi:hypothetical protein